MTENFYTKKGLHYYKMNGLLISFLPGYYREGGIFVVSGGIVFMVSGIFLLVSTGGTAIVVSTLVVSELPETFFVELHAETAMVKVPATARLKISFFMSL